MRHYHRKPAQFELFEPSDRSKIKAMPDWRNLPFQTREVITEMMVRLLMEHAQEPARTEGRDVGEANDD
jgi:hypothetical protein